MRRSRRVLLVRAAVPLTVAALLTGCGGSGASSASRTSTRAPDGDADTVLTTVQRVDCPGRATAADLPAGFPAPLPPGTVVVDVRRGSEGRTVVTGVVPAAEQEVLTGLQQAYPAAGLPLTEGRPRSGTPSRTSPVRRI